MATSTILRLKYLVLTLISQKFIRLVSGLWLALLSITNVPADAILQPPRQKDSAETTPTPTTPTPTVVTELAMKVTASPTSAVADENITYSISVVPTPAGASVKEVMFTYDLPATFTLVSAQASQGNCTPGKTIECPLGTVAKWPMK